MLWLPMIAEKVPDSIAGAIHAIRRGRVQLVLRSRASAFKLVALMKYSLGRRAAYLDAPSTMQIIVQLRRAEPISHRPIATLTLVPHP